VILLTASLQTAELRARCEAIEEESRAIVQTMNEPRDKVDSKQVANLLKRLREEEEIIDEQKDLVRVQAFAEQVSRARSFFGFAQGVCENCGDEDSSKTSIKCSCGAAACGDCLRDAVHAMTAGQTELACFSGADEQHSLPRSEVLCALAFAAPDLMERFVTHSARGAMQKRAVSERVEFMKQAKRARALSLGDRLVNLLTTGLRCPHCNANVAMFDVDGTECMHMTCFDCSGEMCGFCLKTREECESSVCALNPNPNPIDLGANVSASKVRSFFASLAALAQQKA